VEHHGHRRLAERLVFAILHHADDFRPGPFRGAAETRADWIRAVRAEEPPRERLVHDRDGRAVRGVGVGEAATGNHPRAHGSEQIRRDLVVERIRHARAARHGLAFHVDDLRRDVLRERKCAQQARRDDVRCGAETLDEVSLERLAARLIVSFETEIEAQGDRAFRLEPHIHLRRTL
jgi:hypothetical protein